MSVRDTPKSSSGGSTTPSSSAGCSGAGCIVWILARTDTGKGTSQGLIRTAVLRGGLKAGVLSPRPARDDTSCTYAHGRTGKVLPASPRPEPPPQDPGSAVLVPLIRVCRRRGSRPAPLFRRHRLARRVAVLVQLGSMRPGRSPRPRYSSCPGSRIGVRRASRRAPPRRTPMKAWGVTASTLRPRP